MIFDEEQITRELVEEARQLGQLVDLDEEAKQAGLSFRCEVSEPLYRSLFWKYPSAREQDIVSASDFLKVLQSQIENSSRQRVYYYIRPPQPPWWMPSQTFLKVLVLYRDHLVESVVILPQLASLENLFSCLPPSVPATLLVRLFQALRKFGPLCYPSERPMVRSLNAIVRELLRKNPMYAQIHNYFDSRHSPPVRHGFSREEYREVTLRSLLTQLELTSAVAAKIGADIKLPVSDLLQLMALHVGVVPVNEDGLLLGENVPFH